MYKRQIHNNLGIALRAQSKQLEAIAHYEKALAIRPDYAAVHGNLGNTLREQGEFARAAAQYERALEIQPDFADAHLGLGLSLYNQRHLAAARDAYEAGIALDLPAGIAHVALRRVRIVLKTLVPESDVPPDQQVYEDAHPGLRIWNQPVDPGLPDLLHLSLIHI